MDLILRGGRVIDPASGLDATCDVGFDACRALQRAIGSRQRPRAESVLAARAHPDLDSRVDGQRVFFDRIQGRSRVTAALEARHRAFRGPHPHSDLVLRHARGGASGDKVRHERLKSAVFDQRAWTFAASTSMREHRKGADNRVGALGHGISLRRMVHLNANWDHRICLSDFRTSQRPISAFSGQERVGATDAFSRIAYILTIPMSTCESPETDREATRASPIAADVGSMAPRSGEGHDQWCRFAFSLTSRASVVPAQCCETREVESVIGPARSPRQDPVERPQQTGAAIRRARVSGGHRHKRPFAGGG